jgi:16S rRNA processing protein RimM
LSSVEAKALILGRVSGFRGAAGEITVKVVSGDAARWVKVGRVVLRRTGGEADARRVESARAYRDRLVLKLAGIGDATSAATLRGAEVVVAGEDVPRLPADVYWVERLVGARVTDETLGEIGTVADVIEAGGGDLLLVRDGDGVETLVPLVKEFVTAIDEASGTIRLTLPEGLRGLNAPGDTETA